MDPVLGQISIFPWNWRCDGWLKCDGSLLEVKDHQALYCLLMNEFGGKPGVTFAIPKLAPIKTENGGDLDYYIAIEGLFPSRS